MANLLMSSSQQSLSMPLEPPGPVCWKDIPCRLGLSNPRLSFQTKGMALSFEIQQIAGSKGEGDGFLVILCYQVFPK